MVVVTCVKFIGEGGEEEVVEEEDGGGFAEIRGMPLSGRLDVS